MLSRRGHRADPNVSTFTLGSCQQQRLDDCGETRDQHSKPGRSGLKKECVGMIEADDKINVGYWVKLEDGRVGARSAEDKTNPIALA